MAQLNLLQSLVCNALEVIEIKLIREREDVDDDEAGFPPEYAHQVFGKNESIVGYKNLKIRLYYTAGFLNMYLGVKYSYRINDFQNTLAADNIVEKVSEMLTSGFLYTSIDEYLLKLKNEEEFQPYGEKIDSITIENGSRTFEFYVCNNQTAGFQAFHIRLQTFILWFVDAGSYIDMDDPQWVFIVCYEKYKNSSGKTMYATVGYTTIYLYYAYPENIRPRISQMLVLPPFQGLGVGTKLIEVIYKKYQNDPKVKDITVEDPSDEFRRIRNTIDAKLCQPLASFAPNKLRIGFSDDMIKESRDKFKINSRQCRTIYEILRLDCTNTSVEKEYRAYRLEIKKRLNLSYFKQKSELKKMEKAGIDPQWVNAGLPTTEERIEQLKEEYEEIEKEYRHIINKLTD